MSAAPALSPAAPSAAPARLQAWATAGLIAAVLVAYVGSLRGPFIFDDASSITTNPTIRHLWPLSDVLAGPVTNVTAQGRPMLNFSLAINYAISGKDVWSYHAFNLVIHALAALTLFGVLRRMLIRWGCGLRPQNRELSDGIEGLNYQMKADATLIAFCIALLWAVHPLQTEAVTYIIQRAESLLGLFYLLTFYCFLRGVGSDADSGGGNGSRNAGLWLTLAVLVCALGMATKEVMATAPLMVLFYDRTFVTPSFVAALRRRWGFYTALGSTWLLLGWLVLQGGGNRGGSVGFGADVDASAYWLTQFKAVATYLRLTFWPAPLVFEYGTFWIKDWTEIALPVVIVLGLLALTIRGLWRRTAFGFAGAWFFGILAPTSLAPGTTQMIVEHRMYLPLAAVLAVTIAVVWRWATARRQWLVVTGVAVMALLLLTLTVRRNDDYRTDVALWSDTVAKRPQNPLAHFMLAGALERTGDVSWALAMYAEALRLKPNFSVGQENFGELLLKQGRRAEAIDHFEAALRLQPEFADAHANLGNALLAERRTAEAVEHLEKAVHIAPGFFETDYNFANALSAVGRWEEAVVQYRTALKLKPDVPEVQFNLGNALAEWGRPAEAMEAYRVATKLRPDYAAAHYNLANVLALNGRAADAVTEYEAAVLARPDYAEAHHNLGSALFELGRFADAAKHYEETLRLQPDFPNARANLERVRARLRR
jgi:tetratricopeptide (TPR) repeat protein